MNAESLLERGDERQPTRALSLDECWDRLAAAPYGRIAARAGGEIDVFPVNHGVDDHTIVFRTAAGTKLLELTIHQEIVFQIDGFDAHRAFSVAVKGAAEELQTSADVALAERSGVTPWAPEEKDRWVRITPRVVTGVEFDRN